MKAIVDGDMVGLVNDDFVDIQQSDIVWVELLKPDSCEHEVLLNCGDYVECRACGKKWAQDYSSSDQEGVLRAAVKKP